MKILVTGGAGFIGSHIVDQCVAAGYETIVVDNLSTGKKQQIHPKATFFEMDIRDETLAEVMISIKPDVVIHQAAQIHVNTSIEQPLYDASMNVLGTLNVLEACRKAAVKKIVYASTAAVYGDPEVIPIDEQNGVQPLSCYGISKYTPEMYLHTYHALYGLDYTILRYANVYGIRQDPRGEGGVISIFTDKCVSREPLVVFGDGEQTRDYIYVEDVARANLQAIHRGSGEVFNIGTGIQTSLNEAIAGFNKVTERENEVIYQGERLGDIKHSCFDIAKATAGLDWKPEVALTEGLARTYGYYRKS